METRDRYEADGCFVAAEQVLPSEVVAAALEGMEAVRGGRYDTGIPPRESTWKPGDDPNRLCKIEQPQFASLALRALVGHPALGALAAQITGAHRIQAWWVQLLVKPPATEEAATSIGWHQDRSYWGVWTPESELFTAWVALSDVDAASGPMRFVRGSHRWGAWKGSDFWSQDLEGQHAGDPGDRSWEEIPAILPPGGVSFHHNMTIHGSGPNTSGRPRRSLAIHLRTENSRPVDDLRRGLAEFIDDTDLCPVLFQS
jgi:ectoine hydroxylase-related dioxygenase (phytanoyl-CoA dioxygenase family)